MKLNWGNWIAVVYSVFVIFIVFMVYLAFGEKWDLVAENYYEQELMYQEKIDGKANVKDSDLEPQLYIDQGMLLINIPKIGNTNTEREGTINFFRPSDASMDFSTEIAQSDTIEVGLDQFVKGKYMVKINWKQGDEEFYFEQNLIIP